MGALENFKAAMDQQAFEYQLAKLYGDVPDPKENTSERTRIDATRHRDTGSRRVRDRGDSSHESESHQ